MAYFGNIDGPRESLILQRLGHMYFGITPAQLASEIDHAEDSERREEIQPVHVDENGLPYLIFSQPDNKNAKFYFHEHGISLKGDILTHTEKEKGFWKG